MENNNEKYRDKDLNILFEELKSDVLEYADKKFRYFKLEAFEKISIIVSLIGFIVIVLVLSMGLLFFGLFGLAFFLGEMLNSLAAGFGILFAFLFLCIAIMMIFQRGIRRFIMNKAIIVMRKIDSNEEI